jgi:hypothetical protein
MSRFIQDANPSYGTGLGARGAMERRQREADLKAIQDAEREKIERPLREAAARKAADEEKRKDAFRRDMKGFNLHIRSLKPFDTTGKRVFPSVDSNFEAFARNLLRDSKTTITPVGKECLRSVLLRNMSYLVAGGAFTDARVEGTFEFLWSVLVENEVVTEGVEYEVTHLKVHDTDLPKPPTLNDKINDGINSIAPVNETTRVETSIAQARPIMEGLVIEEAAPVFQAAFRYLVKFFNVTLSQQQKQEYFNIFRRHNLNFTYPKSHDKAIAIARNAGVLPDNAVDSETEIQRQADKWMTEHPTAHHQGVQMFTNKIRQQLKYAGKYVPAFSAWDGQ